jgi:CheY-like chemotaxis protein
MSQRVLVVDDDLQTSRGLKRVLEAEGYVVKEENDSTQALTRAREFQPDFVVLDYLMPRVHGGDVAWQLASDAKLRNVRIIVCSGVSAEEVATKLPPARIPILEKPVDTNALLQLLRDN